MPRAKAPKPPINSAAKKHGGERGVDVARKRGKSNSSAASAAEYDVDKPLTDLQKNFVRYWAEGESLTSAAIRAGYDASGAGVAYRLARQPNVLALKAQYSAKYEEAAQMTRKKVMDMHMEAFDMAKLMSEPASMVSAAREIGKMCGYYAPVEVKVKVDVAGNIVANQLNAMTDAELIQAITQGNVPELDYEKDGT